MSESVESSGLRMVLGSGSTNVLRWERRVSEARRQSDQGRMGMVTDFLCFWVRVKRRRDSMRSCLHFDVMLFHAVVRAVSIWSMISTPFNDVCFYICGDGAGLCARVRMGQVDLRVFGCMGVDLKKHKMFVKWCGGV